MIIITIGETLGVVLQVYTSYIFTTIIMALDGSYSIQSWEKENSPMWRSTKLNTEY
jgi:hypothetical protein